MAERVGFEPTIPVKVCPLSRRIVSTAHAPLRAVQRLNFNCAELVRGFGPSLGSGFHLRTPANAHARNRLNFNRSRNLSVFWPVAVSLWSLAIP